MILRFRIPILIFLQTAMSPGMFAQEPGYILNGVLIDAKGITPVSMSPHDTLRVDTKTNTVLYAVSDSIVSTWFKIYAGADCEITFDIRPTGADNLYNYFLYEKMGDLTIREVEAKAIEPIRANLYTDEMLKTGTGLSAASCVSVRNSCTKDAHADFYHTAYHSAVKAVKGQVFLLNIDHVKGKDCGYLFTLNANQSSQKFQSWYRSCYPAELAKAKVHRSVNVKTPPKAVEPVQPVQPAIPVIKTAVFMVRDSLKHVPVAAELTFSKTPNGSHHPEVISKEKGKYEFILEKNRGYHVVFSSIGYKNMEVFFMTDDNLQSLISDVHLSPLKSGDNFVMDKIYFHPNSYYLKDGAQDEIDKLHAYLKNNPGVSIEIQGHTNGNKKIKSSYKSEFKGSAKKLSQYRADKIKKYLVGKGIAPERVIANGCGGGRMIYPKPKNQAQANKNIRVEILILSEKGSAITSNSKGK